MPAWPMSLPSSTGVMIGSVAGVELVVEAEGGRIITKARVPLVGEVTMVSRYLCVSETLSKGSALRSHRRMF